MYGIYICMYIPYIPYVHTYFMYVCTYNGGDDDDDDDDDDSYRVIVIYLE